MKYFEKVTPESVGIASEGILEFLEAVRKKGIELHSFMVLRHDKCAAAGWWKPFAPEYLHPLYSFSKTLTATAIGFARQEGLLSLDDRLVDLFPDEIPEQPSENLKKCTIHHLLCMAGGHETEAGMISEDWISQFLAHPFKHEPGTFYRYNTPGTNMLAAIIKRKTGQNVTEYLRPRFLDPLGISEIVCAQLPDKDHVEMGGAGMRLKTEDMAKVATFLLHKGAWDGRQLLEESWFDLASVKQMETAGDSEGHVKDWAHGYGYQCWMCALPGSFRADGAFGQFGFVFPTLDLVVVTTTATEQTQTLVDKVNEILIPAVKAEVLPASEKAEELEKYLEDAKLPVLLGDRNPDLEKRLTDKVYVAEPETGDGRCSDLKLLIGGAGHFWFQRPVSIDKMWFTFAEDMLIWHVAEGDAEWQIPAALDGRFEISVCDGVTYGATARYRGLNVIEMEVRRTDAISGVRLLFRFMEDEMTVEAEDTLITVGGLGIAPRQTCTFVG